MSTITREFTKEQLQQIIETDHVQCGEASALARIALASLEAEAVCVIDQSNLDYLKSGSDADVWPASRAEMGDVLLYRSATPAPVSVPAAMEMDDDFDSAFEHGKAVGWNAYRAAMLQGVDRPQNEPQNIPENIPATQFKPVADLYGLTSPTGGETSFTFDAVEARDFIDGGWSCQEYVELGRYQEALTDHSEDKLAMVDHSGDSNNMVEPVTTAYKLQDGWVACSERMPEKGRILALFGKRIKEVCENYVDEGYIGSDGEYYFFDWESGPRIDDCHPYDKAIVSHWMYWELPAAPQQEVKP
ncbi:DUF551 domain-containing protein [Enterobacter hormaechei]|uniref:DUF551 domain-containing protein n=1 Tax=Enterobacter hormaechei TaxID=158836 RepID=UPI00345D52B7